MFETFFSRPSTIARYRSAPLLAERVRYLAHCEEMGINRETLSRIAIHQLNLVRVLDLRDDGLNARRIEAKTKRWFLPGAHRSRPPAPQRFFGHSERWLRFLGWLHEPAAQCHGHSREVQTFAAWMSAERGWSDATITGCCRTVNHFFVWLDGRGVDLASVEIFMIDQVIARFHARGFSRSTIHLYACYQRREVALDPPV